MTIKNNTPAVTAFNSIAALAFIEGNSRAAVISAVKVALGRAFKYGVEVPKATKAGKALSAVRTQYIAGRMASSLGFKADKIDEAIAIIGYANAAGTGELKKGQTARRTPVQERAYAAAREYWSKLLADLGIGKAKTTADKNKAARAPRMTTTTEAKEAPKVDNSAKTEKPKTKEQTAAHIEHMASTLLAYVNAHAKIVSPALSSAVHDFKLAVSKAQGASATVTQLKAA